MVEYKFKNPINDYDRVWRQMHNIDRQAISLRFDSFDYKVLGKVYNEYTSEFEEVFDQAKMWEKLND